MKALKEEVKENKNSRELQEQLDYQKEENEHLKNTYNKTYQEMIQAFETFKMEMELKQARLEEEQGSRTEMLESRFRDVSK